MEDQAQNNLLKNGNATSTVVKLERRPQREDQDPEEFTPPDGGSRAWLVMVGSFFCNGIIFGVINSYGVIFKELYEDLKMKNVSDASSKAALVGSLAMGTTFLVSMISGVLTDIVGLQATTFLGGAIACAGFMLSSFAADEIYVLYFTYGVMTGLGGALAYTPSLTILGHYFKKYMGIVNGVVTAGSSVFTIVMPVVIEFFLRRTGLEWTLRMLGVLAAGIMGCSFLFKPVVGRKKRSKSVKFEDAFNVEIWRNPKYVVWALVIPLSLFGYFVPYVHIAEFVKNSFPKDVDGKVPVMCIGITSGLGRLFFGYIADLPKVNRILLQQVSFFSIGLLTLLLPTSAGYFGWLIAISLGMGLFDGCFISLLGPIAFDICGPSGAAQAIGSLLALCSIPLTIGPYVAGLMYDHFGNYDLALRLAGVPPVVAAFAMFAIRCVKKNQDTRTITTTAETVHMNGKSTEIEVREE